MDGQQNQNRNKTKAAKTQTHTQRKRTKRKPHQAIGIQVHTQERRHDEGGSTEGRLPGC